MVKDAAVVFRDPGPNGSARFREASKNSCREWPMTTRENNLPMAATEFAVVAAVNDDPVLKNSLMRSPEREPDREVFIRRGCSSAGQAYNSGMKASTSDIIVFAHQDVYSRSEEHT